MTMQICCFGKKMNEDLQVEKIGNYLDNKKIALCIGGGIAAIEAPKIARHLRRYGADVKIYATQTALKFVGEASLEWGSGKNIVKELSGLAEHICTEDLILIAPATLNAINKIYAGIADDPVTTLVSSALGMKVPVLIAPTMHISMYDNPILQENLKKDYGIKQIKPRFEENKAKIPKLENIVAEVTRELSQDKINGKKILITGGATPGKIDDLRLITNKFKGSLALEIAKDAYHKGANVKLMLGKTGINVPSYLDVTYHEDYYEYYNNVFSELGKEKYNAGIFSAAVADYIPIQKFNGKIKSGGGLESIKLQPTRKIIADVRKKFPELFMVTFKHEVGITEEELLRIAKERINEGYQAVVANLDKDVGEKHKAYIVTGDNIIVANSRYEIAERVLGLIQ